MQTFTIAVKSKPKADFTLIRVSQVNWFLGQMTMTSYSELIIVIFRKRKSLQPKKKLLL